MNRRTISNMVASMLKQPEYTEKMRAIRLYIEKSNGIVVEDTEEKELSNILFAEMKSNAPKKDAQDDTEGEVDAD